MFEYYMYFISCEVGDTISLEILQRYSKRIEKEYQYILNMISKPGINSGGNEAGTVEENMRPYEKKYVDECYKAMQEEHDACGIGLVVNIDGKKEYRTLDDALSIVEKLEHRAGKDATGEVHRY